MVGSDRPSPPGMGVASASPGKRMPSPASGTSGEGAATGIEAEIEDATRTETAAASAGVTPRAIGDPARTGMGVPPSEATETREASGGGRIARAGTATETAPGTAAIAAAPGMGPIARMATGAIVPRALGTAETRRIPGEVASPGAVVSSAAAASSEAAARREGASPGCAPRMGPVPSVVLASSARTDPRRRSASRRPSLVPATRSDPRSGPRGQPGGSD